MFVKLMDVCCRFAEALVRADRDLHEGKPEDMLKISEAIKTVDDYSKLTGQLKHTGERVLRLVVMCLRIYYI